MTPITPISTKIPMIEALNQASPNQSQPSNGTGFQAIFADALNQVSGLQTQAHQKISDFLNGEGAEVHEVAMASQKAELAFDMLQQVRNKVLAAYQEVMKTQL